MFESAIFAYLGKYLFNTLSALRDVYMSHPLCDAFYFKSLVVLKSICFSILNRISNIFRSICILHTLLLLFCFFMILFRKTLYVKNYILYEYIVYICKSNLWIAIQNTKINLNSRSEK